MFPYLRSRIFAASLLGLAAVNARGQASTETPLKWPTCPDLQASDFRRVSVPVKHAGSPIKMQIAEDGRMLFIAMGGSIWSFDPKTGATTTLGTVPVLSGGVAFGLVGIALDPAFVANNRIYLLHSARPAGSPAGKVAYQLWRYTAPGGKLDMASGIKMLEYAADKDVFPVDHGGGGMGFDAQGNLYFATGENSDWNLLYGNVDETRIHYNSLRTAGNTNDLRGKINRIHPEPDGKYTIPAGNLFPPGKDSTKPEIFAMGFRNPWSLEVDKVTGTVLWADVGPQAEKSDAGKGPAGMDEFGATRVPGFFGWPMFMGPNVAYNNYDYAANKTGPLFDSAAPVNASKLNTGLRQLPPARRPIIAYGKDGMHNPWTGFAKGGAVPIAGPIYRYDGKNPSKVKLPPHFDGHWFIAEAFQKWIKAVKMDDQATKAMAVTTAFPGLTYTSSSAYSIISMGIGPDGALYYTENGSNVTYRIEYTGTCLPDVTPSLNLVRNTGRNRFSEAITLLPPGALMRGVDLPAGRHGLEVFDVRGRKVWEYGRREASRRITVAMPHTLGRAMLWVRILPPGEERGVFSVPSHELSDAMKEVP